MAYGKVVEAMKRRDAVETDNAFSEYLKAVDGIKPDVLAPLFRSLSKKEDVLYLDKWLSLLSSRNIEIPENEYVCTNFGMNRRIGIIQFFAGICEEKEALKYVNLILEKGLQIR